MLRSHLRLAKLFVYFIVPYWASDIFLTCSWYVKHGWASFRSCSCRGWRMHKVMLLSLLYELSSDAACYHMDHHVILYAVSSTNSVFGKRMVIVLCSIKTVDLVSLCYFIINWQFMYHNYYNKLLQRDLWSNWLKLRSYLVMYTISELWGYFWPFKNTTTMDKIK